MSVISGGLTTSPYRLGRELGRGAFGTVSLALDVRSGESVAIKRTPLAASRFDVRALELEVATLSRLDSPFIVRYIDSYRDAKSMFLVMEYVEGGSLADLVARHGPLPESLTAYLVAQILVGLSFLHDNGLVHRDIKASNVLISKEGTVRLCDFGLVILDDVSRLPQSARVESGGPATGSTHGSAHWWAPEIVQLREPTAAADIWALGATVIEILTGKPPNGELGALAAAFRIVSDTAGPRAPAAASLALRAFLVATFTRDPGQRPSAQALLDSLWITQALAALAGDPRKATSRLLREVRQRRARAGAEGAELAAAGDAAVRLASAGSGGVMSPPPSLLPPPPLRQSLPVPLGFMPLGFTPISLPLLPLATLLHNDIGNNAPTSALSESPDSPLTASLSQSFSTADASAVSLQAVAEAAANTTLRLVWPAVGVASPTKRAPVSTVSSALSLSTEASTTMLSSARDDVTLPLPPVSVLSAQLQSLPSPPSPQLSNGAGSAAPSSASSPAAARPPRDKDKASSPAAASTPTPMTGSGPMSPAPALSAAHPWSPDAATLANAAAAIALSSPSTRVSSSTRGSGSSGGGGGKGGVGGVGVGGRAARARFVAAAIEQLAPERVAARGGAASAEPLVASLIAALAEAREPPPGGNTVLCGSGSACDDGVEALLEHAGLAAAERLLCAVDVDERVGAAALRLINAVCGGGSDTAVTVFEAACLRGIAARAFRLAAPNYGSRTRAEAGFFATLAAGARSIAVRAAFLAAGGLDAVVLLLVPSTGGEDVWGAAATGLAAAQRAVAAAETDGGMRGADVRAGFVAAGVVPVLAALLAARASVLGQPTQSLMEPMLSIPTPAIATTTTTTTITASPPTSTLITTTESCPHPQTAGASTALTLSPTTSSSSPSSSAQIENSTAAISSNSSTSAATAAVIEFRTLLVATVAVDTARAAADTAQAAALAAALAAGDGREAAAIATPALIAGLLMALRPGVVERGEVVTAAARALKVLVQDAAAASAVAASGGVAVLVGVLVREVPATTDAPPPSATATHILVALFFLLRASRSRGAAAAAAGAASPLVAIAGTRAAPEAARELALQLLCELARAGAPAASALVAAGAPLALAAGSNGPWAPHCVGALAALAAADASSLAASIDGAALDALVKSWASSAGYLLAAPLAALLARAPAVAAILGAQSAFLRASGARVAAAVKASQPLALRPALDVLAAALSALPLGERAARAAAAGLGEAVACAGVGAEGRVVLTALVDVVARLVRGEGVEMVGIQPTVIPVAEKPSTATPTIL